MQPDPFFRHRHTSQAYPVTTFGKALETGKSGYGRRLQGTPIQTIPIILNGAETDPIVIGDLTAGVWVYGVVVHSAGAGTLDLTLQAENVGQADERPEITLFDDLALATVGVTVATTEDQLMPLEVDRVLVGTVTGGDDVVPVRITLLVAPILDSWF